MVSNRILVGVVVVLSLLLVASVYAPGAAESDKIGGKVAFRVVKFDLNKQAMLIESYLPVVAEVHYTEIKSTPQEHMTVVCQEYVVKKDETRYLRLRCDKFGDLDIANIYFVSE